MPGQTRFVTGSGVAMDYTFVDRFVDQRDRREQQFRAHRFILAHHRGAELLDRSTKFAPVVAIDLFSFRILANSLFC